MAVDPSRLERARASLLGLSVGDGFGEKFFGSPNEVRHRIAGRDLPPAPWGWTDDTAMAISIVETLKARGSIDQDELANRFSRRYAEDPGRGYGGGAHSLLSAIASGGDWRIVSKSLFFGQGSWGNGAAMRAAPIGAFFADSPERAADEAAKSAEVTHAHIEGIAGAVAVAVAAALLGGGTTDGWDSEDFFDAVLDLVPAGRIKEGIERAKSLGSAAVQAAAGELGCGHEAASFDTVPFCLWIASRGYTNFTEALWDTVSALGDRDTTCAIVGGILATAGMSPPEEWIAATEALPGTS